MEVFGAFGVSNAMILTAAAGAMGLALLATAAARAVSGFAGQQSLQNRVDRIELRLAAKENYQPVLMAVDALLASAAPINVEPVAEIFEAAVTGRNWFSKRAEPAEIARSVMDDIKSNVELAADIARPIPDMFDDGSIEVAGSRRRVAQVIREKAMGLSTANWDRHQDALMKNGMPTHPATLLQVFFSQTHELKSASAALVKAPSIEGLMDVLRLSASLLQAADDSFEELRRQSTGQKLLPPPDRYETADEAAPVQAESVEVDSDDALPQDAPTESRDAETVH
jgi:hypothetical protein